MGLVYPGVTLLDAVGPVQAFSSANDALRRQGQGPAYEVVMASPSGGPIVTDTGITLGTVSLAEAAARPIDTLVVAGGDGVFEIVGEAAVVDWVRGAYQQGRRIASTCMGAFVTGRAGLLQGRRVTTHWRYVDALQQVCPQAQVACDPLFVRDGKMWSSAGVTAGIDMALAMIEEDLGHQIAMAVAQALVVFLKRPGGQSQFSTVLCAQMDSNGDTFTDLHAWVAAHPDADLSVEALAARTGMSPRSFARHYKACTGLTPARSMERLRVEQAKRLLQHGEGSLAQVAVRSGLTDEQRLRRAFLRHTGISPVEYRDKFGAERA